MARRGAAKEAANDIGRMELKTVVDNRTVGEILREARIARDEDYVHVSEQLRIRRAYMEAIEDGRFGDLPGSTYAIGFVRTYAEYLELDVAKMVAKYKQEAADFEDNTRLVFPEPMPASRGPTASIIIVALLLMVGAYAGWLYISNKDRDQIELVPPLPQALQDLLSRAGVPDPAADEPVQSAAQAPQQPETVAQPEEPTEVNEPVVVTETTTETVVAAVDADASAPVVVNETIAIAQSEPAPETDIVAEQGVTETVAEAAVAIVADTTSDASSETPAVSTPATEAESDAVDQIAVVAEVEPVQQPETTLSAETVEVSETEVTETAEEVAEAIEREAEVSATQVETQVEEQAQVAAVSTEPEQSFSVPVPDASEPTTYGDDLAESRVLIRSKSAAWVEITEPGGNVLLTRLLRPGDTFKVPDRPGITLVTGNAGGLEFVVDGKVAPPIGEIGDVRRDIVLEPDALLKGTGQQNG